MVFCGAFANLPGRIYIEDDDSPLIEQSRFLTSIKKFNKNDGRADDTTIQHLMEKCREKTATSDPHLGREIGLVIADLAIAERNNNKNNDSNSNIKKFTPSKINASSKKGTGNGADGKFWHAALQQQEEVMQLQYEHIQQQLDHQRKEIYKSQTMPRQHHHHDASGTNSNTSDSSPSASIRKRGLQEVGKFLPSSSTSTFHHIHLHNNNNPIHNQNQNQAIISNRHQKDFDHPQNSHNPSIHNHHLSNIPPPNRNNTINHQPHQPQQQHHQRQYTHKLQIQKELHKQQQMQQKSKFCPLCSCLLTYLYQNSHTGHLTEIHGGPDTPTTKESNSIPPYCIGCRAYLLFDWLDEDQRQLLLDNLAKQLEDGLDCDDDDDDDDDGQEGRDDSTTEGRGRGPFDSNGMGNAKIVVVGITSPIHSSQHHDLEEEETEDEEDALEHSKRVFQIATTPRHSNSMDSNSSSTAQSEKKFLFDHMNNAPFASDLSSITNPRFPMQSSRVPSQPYRRKGDVMFEARDFQEDGAHADLTVETVPQKDINDDDQYDQGTISTTNVSPQHKMHGSNDKKTQVRSNDVDNLIRDANTNYNDDRHDQETVSTRITSPRHKQHHGSNVGHESTCHDNSEDDPFSNIEGRDNKQDDVGEDVNEDGNSDKGEELDNNAFEGPFEGPDVAVPSKSFQSCSRCQSCGSQDQSTRDIRLISTNSEEHVILQRYSMK